MFQLMVADLGSPSYFVATAAMSLGFFKEEGIEMGRVEGSMRGTAGLKDGTLHFYGGEAYAPLKTFPNFQGVKLLCALAHRPQLLILDEPFTGLDPISQAEVQALFAEQLKRPGRDGFRVRHQPVSNF